MVRFPRVANSHLPKDQADIILDHRSTLPRSRGQTSASCRCRRKSTSGARSTSCTPCQTSGCASCPYSDRYPPWYASLLQSSNCILLNRSTCFNEQFGNVAAAYVLTQLAGFKMEPLPVKCVGIFPLARGLDCTSELQI